MSRIPIPDRAYHCQDALSDAHNGFQQKDLPSAMYYNFILQSFPGNVGEAQGVYSPCGDHEIMMEVVIDTKILPEGYESVEPSASEPRWFYTYDSGSRTWIEINQVCFEDMERGGLHHVFLKSKDCEHGVEHWFKLWFSPRCYQSFKECSTCQSGKCDEHIIEATM